MQVESGRRTLQLRLRRIDGGLRVELRGVADCSAHEVAGIEDLDRYTRFRLDHQNAAWRWVRLTDNSPLDPDVVAQVSGVLFPEGSSVAAALIDALRRRKERPLVILLSVAGTAVDAQQLFLLPWELAQFADDNGVHPLVDQYSQLVRILPGDADDGGPDPDAPRAFLAASFASPLYRHSDTDLDAFNAEVMASRVRQKAKCGFLTSGEILTFTSRADWKSLAESRALVKLFFGHGKAVPNQGDHLVMFKNEDWQREPVGGDELHGYFRDQRGAVERLLVLCACDSYRVVLAALAPGGQAPGDSPRLPMVLATLSPIPLALLDEVMPRALSALSATNDAVEMMREVRRACVGRDWMPFARAFVLFAAQPGEPDPFGRLPVMSGLTREVRGGCSLVGLAGERLEDLFKTPGLGLPPGTGRTPPTSLVHAMGATAPSARRVAFETMRVTTTCVTRWQMFLQLGEARCRAPSPADGAMPAIVTRAAAEEFARRVGGRLLTPDEWEYCAVGHREENRLGPVRIHETSLHDLARLRGPFQTPAFAATGMQDVTSVPDVPPTAFGLKAMLGNVAEWAVDGSGAFAMGGSHSDSIGYCLPQLRFAAKPDEKLAFRVAWTVAS